MENPRIPIVEVVSNVESEEQKTFKGQFLVKSTLTLKNGNKATVLTFVPAILLENMTAGLNHGARLSGIVHKIFHEEFIFENGEFVEYSHTKPRDFTKE